MRRLHRLAAGAAVLCAMAVAVPAASADSIAYVKGGDVWIASPDGAEQVRITTSGAYQDVSQADDGTMIALTGVRLHRLDRRGKVLADFDTPVSDTRPAGSRVFFGPYDPAISPDGTKIAYTYYYMTTTQDRTCYPPECVIGIREGGTGYSHADRQTAWDEPGFRKHSGWRHPAWVDNRTLLLSNPTHLPNKDVVVDILDGEPVGMVRNWFSDLAQGNPHVSGGDITRDRTKMAFQTGENDSTLTLYAVPTFPTAWRDSEPSPPADPIVCYRYGDANGGRFGVPTFSPDGGRLAWAEADGVHVAVVPSFAGGCTAEGATQTAPLVIPGASEPDWGPADVPEVPKEPDTPRPDDPAPAKATATVRRAPLGTALRRGLKVSVTLPADGRVAATARRAGTVLAKARSRSLTAGRRTLTLRFTKAGRRTMARRRKATLAVRVTYVPAGGTPQVTKLAARLKR